MPQSCDRSISLVSHVEKMCRDDEFIKVRDALGNKVSALGSRKAEIVCRCHFRLAAQRLFIRDFGEHCHGIQDSQQTSESLSVGISVGVSVEMLLSKL